jgi:uncharacterized 2Fe-2S/4Fe-4S cluster protein (DUF4445 family)
MKANPRHGPVRIELQPLGETLEVEKGTPLQDVLFTHGVEFPCGGRGKCLRCRVRVLKGSLPVTPEDEENLPPKDLEEGWRLACEAKAEADLVLELAQWESTILTATDESKFEFTPRDGLGIAIDLGTTTLVAQLLDLRTGYVLGVRAALNPQARHGADIMSRVDFAMAADGQRKLEHLVRQQLGRMIHELFAASKADEEKLTDIVIVGNTVMHHLFCGISIEPMAHYPFEPTNDGLQVFKSSDLGWKLKADPAVRFLPCLGGFVGSDILGGILATRLHRSPVVHCLVDLGTNGEIVIGNQDRMLCASTAAGPAFEGARISMGMRASTGAISEVSLDGGRFKCRVLGNGKPRGICGSGLVDAVARALDLGSILPGGRFTEKDQPLMILPPVTLTQNDIRELQLAKGAISAGLRILIEKWGSKDADPSCIYLAGAFGNYISLASARRIGLLRYPPEKIIPSGNTALLGAKIALFSSHDEESEYARIRKKMEHVSLNTDLRFQDIYAEEMIFPEE